MVMVRSEGGQTTAASQEPETLDLAIHAASHEDGGN